MPKRAHALGLLPGRCSHPRPWGCDKRREGLEPVQTSQTRFCASGTHKPSGPCLEHFIKKRSTEAAFLLFQDGRVAAVSCPLLPGRAVGLEVQARCPQQAPASTPWQERGGALGSSEGCTAAPVANQNRPKCSHVQGHIWTKTADSARDISGLIICQKRLRTVWSCFTAGSGLAPACAGLGLSPPPTLAAVRGPRSSSCHQPFQGDATVLS